MRNNNDNIFSSFHSPFVSDRNARSRSEAMSDAERAMRDQYCGYLEVGMHKTKPSPKSIIRKRKFNALQVKEFQPAAGKPAQDMPLSEVVPPDALKLETVTLEEAAEILKKHKGSRLMVLVPENDNLSADAEHQVG